MNRALPFALAVIAIAPVCGVAFAATPPQARAANRGPTGNAPADEYFGPLKYSAISVRSKITALARSYRERWSDDASIVHDAGLVESSYRAWAQRYPHDAWLAPTAYHLAELYAELQTPDARAHAKSMFAYVAHTFPSSKEAHSSRLRLHQGFPALHGERPVSPTPSPYGPRAVSPSAAAASAAPAATTPSTGSSPPARSTAPATSAPASPAAASPAPALSPAH